MAKTKTIIACSECGRQVSQWVGRCPDCGTWGSIVEHAAMPSAAGGRSQVAVPQLVALGDVDVSDLTRMSTGVKELDRVLGGGIVSGSVVLLGGEPGIGKSTLALQVLANMALAGADTVLVTGEESPAQVASRAERLAVDVSPIRVLADTRLEVVSATLDAARPTICVIDSIQTVVSDATEGAPGSVSQVRLAAAELVGLAKRTGTAMILVGQVTKDGGLAGPRTLEHLVDCVLTFEGDPVRELRIVRSVKNRFGATNETAVFSMQPEGLAAIEDPSAIYLAEAADRVGSCIYPAVEGSRTVLVEIQALVGPTEVVPPRRVAVGVDRTRLAQVIAVLTRHAGRRLGDQDVFVSVAAGARALDPAADLAIALAIVSADRGRPLEGRPAAFGELGLTGAVRPVGHHDRRVEAAQRHGVAHIVCPVRPTGEAVAGEHPAMDVAIALDVACG